MACVALWLRIEDGSRDRRSSLASAAGQPAVEKRDDKAFIYRQEGEVNLRAAIQVNAVSASLSPPSE